MKNTKGNEKLINLSAEVTEVQLSTDTLRNIMKENPKNFYLKR